MAKEGVKLLDGKKVAEKVHQELKEKILSLKKSRPPGLAAVLVGDDEASHIYVGRKEKAAKVVGMYSEVHRLPKSVSEEELLKLIQFLNDSKKIDGILVQLPLPAHIPSDLILKSVSAEKDVDGFHPINLGKLLMGAPSFIPCTPKGIMKMFHEYRIDVSGKKAVVIGRSLIVGKPMSLLLLQANATVTICHSKTKDLENECKTADIIIAAAGKPKLVKKTFVKPGAVVVDVGIHRMDDHLVGDVDFDEVKEVAGYLTPVPGGVGPMTIAMLLENTWESFEQRQTKREAAQ